MQVLIFSPVASSLIGTVVGYKRWCADGQSMRHQVKLSLPSTLQVAYHCVCGGSVNDTPISSSILFSRPPPAACVVIVSMKPWKSHLNVGSMKTEAMGFSATAEPSLQVLVVPGEQLSFAQWKCAAMQNWWLISSLATESNMWKQQHCLPCRRRQPWAVQLLHHVHATTAQTIWRKSRCVGCFSCRA